MDKFILGIIGVIFFASMVLVVVDEQGARRNKVEVAKIQAGCVK